MPEYTYLVRVVQDYFVDVEAKSEKEARGKIDSMEVDDVHFNGTCDGAWVESVELEEDLN